MTNINPETLIGETVHGNDGEKLGKVEQVYLDNESGKPEWAAIKSGMLGGHIALVPLATATQSDKGLQVPFDKEQVKEAPHHDPGREISQEDEAELFRHYGVAYGGETVTAEPGQAPRQEPPTGQARSGDDAMTRSEEQLRVSTQNRESGNARLRKYVVTEQVSQTVPVSREEARVEREPITDANRAGISTELGEETQEVTLQEETPVVEKEVVAKERVKLTKETVSGETTVEGEVRKERIDEETAETSEPRR